MDLFSSNEPDIVRMDMEGADVILHVRPDLGEATDDVYRRIDAEADWSQRMIRIAGREILQPRLTAWHGDPGLAYTYSGRRHEPASWTPEIARLRDLVSEIAGERFNSVLLNLYRDGRDSMGFHADDERSLGPDPVVASLSLGAPRTFEMRPKKGRAGRRTKIELKDGSLLVMGRGTQINWEHGIRKAEGAIGPRINATFRRIMAI